MPASDKSQPSTEIACFGKGRSVSDSCNERCGVESADPFRSHLCDQATDPAVHHEVWVGKQHVDGLLELAAFHVREEWRTID